MKIKAARVGINPTPTVAKCCKRLTINGLQRMLVWFYQQPRSCEREIMKTHRNCEGGDKPHPYWWLSAARDLESTGEPFTWKTHHLKDTSLGNIQCADYPRPKPLVCNILTQRSLPVTHWIFSVES